MSQSFCNGFLGRVELVVQLGEASEASECALLFARPRHSVTGRVFPTDLVVLSERTNPNNPPNQKHNRTTC